MAVAGAAQTTKEAAGGAYASLPTLPLPSPAQASAAINRGIEQGGNAVAGAVKTANETVGGAYASLPTLPIPSAAQAAEAANRAIDTGAPRGVEEQEWAGEAGMGGGMGAGLGAAYEQQARVRSRLGRGRSGGLVAVHLCIL